MSFPKATFSHNCFVSASVPIQIFLAWRIKVLSRSWIIFGFVAACSCAQGACGIAGGILALRLSEWVYMNSDELTAETFFFSPADFPELLGVADSWVSIAVFTDSEWAHFGWLFCSNIRLQSSLRRWKLVFFTKLLLTCVVRLLLFIYLRKSKTGFKSTYFALNLSDELTPYTGTDSIITSIIRTAIETSAVGAVFAVRWGFI